VPPFARNPAKVPTLVTLWVIWATVWKVRVSPGARSNGPAMWPSGSSTRVTPVKAEPLLTTW
jgi:hypothetical protein